MSKYISGLLTGVLLGAFTYSVLYAYAVSIHPEMGQKYTEYVKACIH